jgi:phenylacetate-CoA ligase
LLTSDLATAIRRSLLSIYWKSIKRSETLQYYRELKEFQWNTVQENREIQGTRLYNLVSYAIENVPYYMRIAKEREIRPSQRTIFEDIKKFPVLTKNILQRQFDELYRFRDNTYYLNSSGGSTGEPVTFYHDETSGDWIRAIKLLFNEWAGREIGAPLVKLWGSERDLFQGGQGFKAYVVSRLHGMITLNSFRMSEQAMTRYVRRINRMKPSLIVAYVASIDELARFVEQRGIPLYSPTGIITSAGVLYPDIRERVQRVFRAPVFNRYGTREVGDIACECSEHNGLHTLPQVHYLEIVGRNQRALGATESGEIVVTTLTNYTMPLIRYRIGDRARLTEKVCPCGRGLPLLESVSGRVMEVFVNQKGEFVSPVYFAHLLGVVYNSGFIEKFQVVQEDYHTVTIKLILSPGYGPREVEDQLDLIADKVRLVMGKECKVSYEFVEDIPPTKSGKYLYTVSKVAEAKGLSRSSPREPGGGV